MGSADRIEPPAYWLQVRNMAKQGLFSVK